LSAPVDDVRGLWRRTIYRRGNEERDGSTEVFWLQGPRFFADIRQPMERASFPHVGCLRDLNTNHLTLLASQEAFAGRLELSGDAAWWRRTIDLQPQGAFEDRARLLQAGNVLEEYGTEQHYYERWERGSPSTSRCWGLQLMRLTDGRSGFLVRADGALMFGRGRKSALPLGRTLIEVLDEIPTLEGKQDLFDFEVSLGTVTADGHEWLIERSTLPFKEERLWSIRLRADELVGRAGVIEIGDLDSEGNRFVDAWGIVDVDHPDAAVELCSSGVSGDRIDSMPR
jgi:hypothetical protein